MLRLIYDDLKRPENDVLITGGTCFNQYFGIIPDKPVDVDVFIKGPHKIPEDWIFYKEKWEAYEEMKDEGVQSVNCYFHPNLLVFIDIIETKNDAVDTLASFDMNQSRYYYDRESDSVLDDKVEFKDEFALVKVRDPLKFERSIDRLKKYKERLDKSGVKARYGYEPINGFEAVIEWGGDLNAGPRIVERKVKRKIFPTTITIRTNNWEDMFV